MSENNFYTTQTLQTQVWARQAEWPVECLNPVKERFPETRPKELWQGNLIICPKKLNMFILSLSSLLLGIQTKKIIRAGNKDLCVKGRKFAPGHNRWQAVSLLSRKLLSFCSPSPPFYFLLLCLPPTPPVLFPLPPHLPPSLPPPSPSFCLSLTSSYLQMPLRRKREGTGPVERSRLEKQVGLVPLRTDTLKYEEKIESWRYF